MIVSKCPLRISLAGGSTDSPLYLKKYKVGKVISFTPNLYTYTSLHKDINGFNNIDKKYILSYSELQACQNIKSVKNEVIKVALSYFNADPVKVSLNADVFSLGSGLASSSSYFINLVSSFFHIYNIKHDILDICKTAYQLESKINPFNGYQDTYGCGLPGFKLLEFTDNGNVKCTKIESNIFEEFDFYLAFTGIKRKSNNILKTINIDKSFPLIKEVNSMLKALKENNYDSFFKSFNESWMHKKETSTHILNNKILKNIDKKLLQDSGILGHKLCGAGGGGYFLIITAKDYKINIDKTLPNIKISLENNGLQTIKL